MKKSGKKFGKLEKMLYLCIKYTKMGENCKKCGMTLHYQSHIEEECDFVPINWDDKLQIRRLTYVEDIEPEVHIESSIGLGVVDIVNIYNIMNKIWKNHKGPKLYVNYPHNQDLFNKAKEEYEAKL